MAPNDDEAAETPRRKVGRLIEAYDLGTDYGAQLEAAWTGEDGDRTSLRDLAEEFNHDLLAAAMREADAATTEGDVDSTFRLLTDDDVTAGTRTETRSRLERAGVDVEQLEGDFVTYQAIRSYLQNERGAEYDNAADGDRVERTAESIGRLTSRLETVTESNLARLRDTDQVTLGEFRLFTSVDVLCTDCGTQYTVEELLARGGCDCDEGSEQ
jgi:hypothetical protein